LVENCNFLHTPPVYLAPQLGDPRRDIAIGFGTEKLEWCGEKSLVICLAILIQYRHVMDRWTDRQTSCDSIVRAMHTHRVAKLSSVE